jgi:cell division protein FtsA
MEESDAEKMKLKYASAYTDNNDIDNNLKYSIDSERQVESRKFIEIVEGRLEEIIENVWYQIPSEYYDKLLGGIILTGGGSNMNNIEQAFMNHTHVEKIRTAKFVTHTINATQEDIKAKNGKMNTVLGLLAKGDMNCAGSAVTDDLFSSQSNSASQSSQVTPNRQARQASEIPAGVIRTEAEKQKAEEERRRQEEEAERIRQEEQEAERQRIAAEKRENSFWNKFLKKAKKFGEDMVKEEE